MRGLGASLLWRYWMGAALAGLLFLSAPRAQAQTLPTCEEIGGTCRPTTQDGLCESGEQQDRSGTCAGTLRCCATVSCEDRGGACQPGVSVCGSGTSALGNATCSSGKCCTLPTEGPTCGELIGNSGGHCSPYSDSCPERYTNLGPTKDGCQSCCDPGSSGPPFPPGSGGTGYRVEYVHTDPLGSVRLVTDQTGAVVSRADYYPFGEQIGVDGEVTGRADASIVGYTEDPNLRQRFTGKERDGESRLDYYGARYFSGAQGRFTTPDLPFADQRIGQPQSWNLYAYARNAPLNYVDPTGRGALWIQASAGRRPTLVIPVHFVGEHAAPKKDGTPNDRVRAIVSRLNGLRVDGNYGAIKVINTDKPIGGVLNTLDYSPGKDYKTYNNGWGEGTSSLGGDTAHIDSAPGNNSVGAAAHDILHFAGIDDQYKVVDDPQKGRVAVPKPGSGYDDTNIMVQRTGTTLKGEQLLEAERNLSTKQCTGDLTTPICR